ncbi:MAG: selenocysteine-specific translation elongation factor [SAR202 cluster bacterium]|nr:selenocysteine-specific translation elongation factor [SAR202 cluster bacterium]
MFVIGTAGHVDHGKSTLVHALTGIDPDRLQEEKERGMTIELGFAWLKLPSGLEVSVVDVPGHERFIKNMLMGVGGIDLALLVVAADEGVMPQTREHLAILDLLRIGRGVVAITKKDMVDDEWLGLVTAEVAELLEGTALAGSPIVPVSATKGMGLDALKETIEESLAHVAARSDLGRPRLPVDRSFTIAGFGTVVTGTLQDGRMRVGQEIEILPGRLAARIRGLQTHRKAVDEALPGTRVAINLSGVSYDQIKRGDVLTIPKWLRPTAAFDASLRIIEGAPRPVRHNARVTLYTGAVEVEAVVRLLDANELHAGDHGWAQLRADAPVAVVKGDYFVIRDSASTLGGGNVVDPSARRHRRFDEATLTRLGVLARGSEHDLILSALETAQGSSLAALSTRANLSHGEARRLVNDALEQRAIVALGPELETLYSARGWSKLAATAGDALAAYHRQYPLRPGMPREELRSRMQMKASPFLHALALLTEEQVLKADDAFVRLPGHSPAVSPEQQRVADDFVRSLATSPFTPPTDQKLDPELLNLLLAQGKVVRANEDVVFLKSAYEEMAGKVVARIQASGKVGVSDVRDMFGQSRKYVLALLEYMDRMQVTRRVGDDRVLR